MNPKFIEWVIKQHEKMDPISKASFLQALKSSQQEVREYIQENLMDWAMFAAVELNKVIACYNTDEATEEVFKALYDRFAPDLATLPA